MADFGADTQTEAFRDEARAWLSENFPPSLAHAGPVLEDAVCRASEARPTSSDADC